MKKLIYLSLLLLLPALCFAQKKTKEEVEKNIKDSIALDNFLKSINDLYLFDTSKVQNGIGRLVGLQDVYGAYFKYTGQIKNGQPNGKGLAINATNEKQKYIGEFENGQFNGRGTLWYSDGSVKTGTWKNGKSDGANIIYVDKNNGISSGIYTLGNRNGEMKYISADGSMFIQNFIDGKLNGRILSVTQDNKNFSDNMYVNGTKNGQGYQYEVNTKKLFEGIWKDGKWLQASTGNYESFLAGSTFSSLDDDKRLLIYEKLSANGSIEGTCFALFKETGIRRLGNFKDGDMTAGMKCDTDDNRYIGNFKNKLKDGFGVGFIKNAGLSLGDHKNGNQNGLGETIDIQNNSVYSGNFVNDLFMGQGFRCNGNNIIEIGNFNENGLNGLGTVIKSNGNWASGKFTNGIINRKDVKSIGLTNGKIIDPQPTTFNKAMDDLIGLAYIGFDNLESTDAIETVAKDAYEVNSDPNSWYAFPGFNEDHITTGTSNTKIFYSEKYNIKGYQLAQKTYTDLCNEILATKITTRSDKESNTFAGQIIQLTEKDKYKESIFKFLSENLKKPSLKVTVEKQGDVYYRIKLSISEAGEDF